MLNSIKRFFRIAIDRLDKGLKVFLSFFTFYAIVILCVLIAVYVAEKLLISALICAIILWVIYHLNKDL